MTQRKKGPMHDPSLRGPDVFWGLRATNQQINDFHECIDNASLSHIVQAAVTTALLIKGLVSRKWPTRCRLR